MTGELFREKRARYLLAAADFLAAHQTAEGDFHPPSSRAGYNEAYDAKGMFTVLQALLMSERERAEKYATVLARRLRRFQALQKTDGALPLFPDKADVIGITVGAAPAIAWWYRRETGSAEFDQFARRCLDYLTVIFDDRSGFKDPHHNTYALRYNDEFPLYACHLWGGEHAAAAALVERATDYVTRGPTWDGNGRFWRSGEGVSHGVELDQHPHPTLDLDRAWVLFEIHGLRFAGQIRDSIAANCRSLAPLEAFYTEEGVAMADCRIRMALAGLMETYDRYTQTDTFGSTPTCREWLAWTVAMFDEKCGGFRERIPSSTGQPEYYGVPAQYLAQYALGAGLLNRDWWPREKKA